MLFNISTLDDNDFYEEDNIINENMKLKVKSHQ